MDEYDISVWAMYRCLMEGDNEEEMLKLMTPRDRKMYEVIKGKGLVVCFDFRKTPKYCTECFYNGVKGEYRCLASDCPPQIW